MKYFVRQVGNKVEIVCNGKAHATLFTNMADAIKAKDLVTSVLSQLRKEDASGDSRNLPESE